MQRWATPVVGTALRVCQGQQLLKGSKQLILDAAACRRREGLDYDGWSDIMPQSSCTVERQG